MNPVLSAVLLLFTACMGAACARTSAHWLVLLFVLILWLVQWARSVHWRRPAITCLAAMLCVVSIRCATAAVPRAQQGDPSQVIPLEGTAVSVHLIGRVRSDGPVRDGRCRTLLEVSRLNGERYSGLTELTLDPCTTPLRTGAWLEVSGPMRRPQPAAHPLLPNAAERLGAQGSWSRLRTDSIRVLRQDWTPLADARRRIARRFIDVAGQQQGALMAALVLGSAQVPLPQALRDGFRVAGLSHALAASGFHLSVLLGTILACTRAAPAALTLCAGGGAMGLFLALAGAQASVVRAVLMSAASLLIGQGGQRSRPLGVLLISLIGMLMVHPAWARSVGFQLSAAATAGLVISASPLEAWMRARLPPPLHRLGSPLAVACAALLWTLPLQLLHFGSAPLYAVISNLLVAPLLAPLTLASMALAVMVLVMPMAWSGAWLPWLIWPVQQLAAALVALVQGISRWPGAQVLTGRVPLPLVLLFASALLVWCLPELHHWRRRSVLLLFGVVGLQLHSQLGDDWIHVEQWGRQWLLLRHRGRAALVSSHGDGLSCHLAQRLIHGSGHQRLDWIAVLDPVGMAQRPCWQALTHTLQAEQQGRPPLAPGQRLQSDGLSLGVADAGGRTLLVSVGSRSVRLRRRDLRPEVSGRTGA